MELSIVIVSYNVRYYLEQCLVSVFRATEGLDCEVFVVDNHSRDDSVEHIRELFGERVHLIASNHNLGFARANNKAIAKAQGKYVLLLNPDTFVGESSIRQALQFMESHEQAGGVGVRMHNADGSVARESRRGLPTPLVSLGKMLGFSNRYYMSHLSWNEPGRIEVISGAFCLLRRDALNKVGWLDEDFFMYGEDIDLSYRVLKGGYENWYVPASILHYKGESTQKSSFRYVHVFYQAMLIFFRKHYSHLSFLVSLPIKLAIYTRAAIALAQTQYWRMRTSLGFISKPQHSPLYCFVGSHEMLEECRLLAERTGLDARYYSDRSQLKEACDVLVYDTDSWTFDQVLDDASRHPGAYRIGTYSCKSKVLITSNDVVL